MEEAGIAAVAVIEDASDLPSARWRRVATSWARSACGGWCWRWGRRRYYADGEDAVIMTLALGWDGAGGGGRLATLVGRIARMSTTTADKARIEAQIALIPRLRGTGPNPFDYDQWDARTAEILTAAFGADSDEVARYQRVVGEAGRVAGVRGNAGNMTLNIHGQWGILERLERAESLLRELASG